MMQIGDLLLRSNALLSRAALGPDVCRRLPLIGARRDPERFAPGHGIRKGCAANGSAFVNEWRTCFLLLGAPRVGRLTMIAASHISNARLADVKFKEKQLHPCMRDLD